MNFWRKPSYHSLPREPFASRFCIKNDTFALLYNSILMRATFQKSERLKSRRQIGRLFQQRQSVGAYPLRLFWGIREGVAAPHPVSIGFSVPKRLHKRAVHRNRQRRLLQEAFRLNKALLYPALEEQGIALNLMLVYVGKEVTDFATIQRKYQRLIQKLLTALTDPP